VVNRLANRFHDRFLHSVVAGVPPLLQTAVVDQLIASMALLLAGAEAALGFATGLLTVAVVGGAAAIVCSRSLDSPEQADQRSHQRHSQAHPHELASSSARGQLCKIVRLGSGLVRDPLTGIGRACGQPDSPFHEGGWHDPSLRNGPSPSKRVY